MPLSVPTNMLVDIPDTPRNSPSDHSLSHLFSAPTCRFVLQTTRWESALLAMALLACGPCQPAVLIEHWALGNAAVRISTDIEGRLVILKRINSPVIFIVTSESRHEAKKFVLLDLCYSHAQIAYMGMAGFVRPGGLALAHRAIEEGNPKHSLREPQAPPGTASSGLPGLHQLALRGAGSYGVILSMTPHDTATMKSNDAFRRMGMIHIQNVTSEHVMRGAHGTTH